MKEPDTTFNAELAEIAAPEFSACSAVSALIVVPECDSCW